MLRLPIVAIIAITVLVDSALGTEAENLPRLCVAPQGRAIEFAKDCVAADARSAVVDAAPAERQFVWLDRGPDVLILGTIAAGESRVVRPDRGSEVTLEIRVPGARRPSEVTLRVVGSNHEDGWRWVWRSRELAGRHMLRLPRGRFTIHVHAKGFRSVEQAIDVEGKPLRLPPVNLESLPVISATILLPDGRGAAGTTVTSGAQLLAIADSAGRFSAGIQEEWPETLSLSASGFATKLIEVPKARADIDFGTIKLVKGGVLDVVFEGDTPGEEMHCEVRRADRLVRSSTRKSTAERLTFERLEPGRYQVRVRGREPLQVFCARVKVEAERVVELPVKIVSHSLHVRTYLGSEKLPDAKVWLRSTEFGWEGSVTTDGDGRVVTDLWHPGQFLVSAETAAVARQYGDLLTVEDVEDPELTFRLPNRKVSGTVIDSETNLPIAHAELVLETARPGPEHIGISTRGVTDDAGRFAYHTVAAGHQKVTVNAEGFLRSTPLEFDLQEGDIHREVTVRLQRGVERKIIVTDAEDVPIGEAAVVESASGRFIGYRTTDYTGKMSFQLPAGEERTLFVIPRSGSFAVARLSAATNEVSAAPLRIIVPSPLATLDVMTQTRSGAPVPNILFLLRYNGQVIPSEVLQLLDRVQGLKFFTDATGVRRLTNVPLGTYELWPVMSAADAKAVLANIGPAAPARVDVLRGENSAVLTFAAAR